MSKTQEEKELNSSEDLLVLIRNHFQYEEYIKKLKRKKGFRALA